MDVTINKDGSMNVAIINSSEILISDTDDALDLMVTIRNEYNCDTMIINKSAITERFFDLKTGIAGEILLKFSNYHFKVAIIGDFEIYTSNSMRGFIRESNKGNQFFFLPSEESALAKFHGL
jgi:hypothetical protein